MKKGFIKLGETLVERGNKDFRKKGNSLNEDINEVCQGR
jgi:hypothetical protein